MSWNLDDKILDDKIFESFFIDGNFTAEKYKNMLRDEIVLIIHIVGSNFVKTMFDFRMGHRLTTLYEHDDV